MDQEQLVFYILLKNKNYKALLCGTFRNKIIFNNGLIIQFLGSRTAMVDGVITYPIALNAVLSIVTSAWTSKEFFGNDTGTAKYSIATRSHLGANETTLTKCRVNTCHFVLIIGI